MMVPIACCDFQGVLAKPWVLVHLLFKKNPKTKQNPPHRPIKLAADVDEHTSCAVNL